MKFFTKCILIFFIICATAQITHAQAVTQAWATLASGAHPQAIAIDGSGNVYTA